MASAKKLNLYPRRGQPGPPLPKCRPAKLLAALQDEDCNRFLKVTLAEAEYQACVDFMKERSPCTALPQGHPRTQAAWASLFGYARHRAKGPVPALMLEFLAHWIEHLGLAGATEALWEYAAMQYQFDFYLRRRRQPTLLLEPWHALRTALASATQESYQDARERAGELRRESSLCQLTALAFAFPEQAGWAEDAIERHPCQEFPGYAGCLLACVGAGAAEELCRELVTPNQSRPANRIWADYLDDFIATLGAEARDGLAALYAGSFRPELKDKLAQALLALGADPAEALRVRIELSERDRELLAGQPLRPSEMLIVDWRAEEEEILQGVYRLLPKQDRHMSHVILDDLRLIVRYKGKEAFAQLQEEIGDRYRALRAVNRALAGEYELRLLAETYDSDTHCFLLRPSGWWKVAERECPAELAERFWRITDSLGWQ